MLRRLAPIVLCVSALLCSAHFTSAGNALRVDESKSRFFFDDKKDETARAALFVVNPTPRTFEARVTVELLDTEDTVRASGEQTVVLKPSANVVAAGLPFSVSKLEKIDSLPWYRLRYRVAAAPGAAGAAPAGGVVSLSEINPDFFELQVSGPEDGFDGMRYRARVRATHPSTHRPVKGVRVSGKAEIDGDDEATVQRASATTDADGFATLDFELPRENKEDHFHLEFKGRLNGVERTLSGQVDIERRAEVIISTDKPIYQPGQTLHVRALVVDAFAGRAVADTPLVFNVSGPDGARLFRAEARTTRFGVASCDWPIAEATKLGEYTVGVEVEGDEYDDARGEQTVRVSRYELPNFAVKVEPDRKFYLPGQNAEVVVRADYLFGKPVPRGRVRVVRESQREWDYWRQKWDVTEGEKFEGETDAEGRFVARVDLAETHRELSGDDGTRYRDLTYAAYFTDSSTNRTEQRRFDLRVTRDALHVYVVKPRHGAGQTAALPLEFYVSAFYPDGTPANASIEVYARRKPPQLASLGRRSLPLAGLGLQPLPAATRAPALYEVKTNRYGFAKIERLALKRELLDEDDGVTLEVRARDAAGGTGGATESFDLAERNVIRVETDKTIHRAGEPLRARITSNRHGLPVAFDVIRDRRVVYSGSARLAGGSAAVVIPYRREFRNEVTIAAYALPEVHGGGEVDAGTRTVIYPRGRELQFDVRLDKEEYRPGEEARADVRLRDADGREVEGALGVVVTDSAVDERARTDREFGGRRSGGGRGGGFANYVLGKLGAGEGLAGLTRRDLDRLDTSKPLPAGLDLLAEIMLTRGAELELNTFGEGFARNQRLIFAAALAERLKPLREAIDRRDALREDYPRDEAGLRRELLESGVNLDELRDPWGTPFRVWFGTQKGEDVLEVITASADKHADTGDDFIALRRGWPYFRRTGLAVEGALKRRRERTGEIIRDRAALAEELRADGVDFEALRDRWGSPYQIDTETRGKEFRLNVRSAGPDMRYGANDYRRLRDAQDDFVISTARVNYFKDVERVVNTALERAAATAPDTRRFPRDEASLRALLAEDDASEKLLLDTWGRPYRMTFAERAWAGRAVVRSVARHGEKPKDSVEPTPEASRLHTIAFTSNGPDGQPNTWDDIHLHTFARVLDAPTPATTTMAPRLVNVSNADATHGGLTGAVVDPNGAVVPGAVVRARRAATSDAATATTDENGVYAFHWLAPDTYEVRVEAAGFKNVIITDVVIKAGMITTADVVVEAGAVSEVVTVTAEAGSLNESTASMSMTVVEQQITELPVNGRNFSSLLALRPGAAGTGRQQAATPRLREYFPETLLWQPSVETDAGGRTSLRFKLADNITTWKMTLIGSTLDGQLGVAEREVRAFQPFFAELDPPRVLTEGDEIALPVVLRNYLDRAQSIEVEMKPEGWFALLGPARKRTEVPAGDSARAFFDLRAVASVREGKQRVTALGPVESDAVEKTVSVHPDGDELTGGETQVFGGSGQLDFDFPASTVANSARAELKIYPNLLSHVIEGVEGVMRRPYGCGEQTISSTYPSLLVLRHHRRRGAAAKELPAPARKAETYVREGYERLLGYQHSGGGFTYWGGASAPNLALTAYALRFMRDAAEVVPVEEQATLAARNYLVREQRADGSWAAYADAAPDVKLTAYIARVMASYEQARKGNKRNGADGVDEKAATAALERALDFLARHAAASADPYALASYVLAATASGQHDAARQAARQLDSLRQDGDGESYWPLNTSTPFYGWGLTGAIETTALAVKALQSGGVRSEGVGEEGAAPSNAVPTPSPTTPHSPTAARDRSSATRGLLFLLRHKDGHGVWHSTQATVNVLDALSSLLPNERASDASGGSAEVFVNGRHVATLQLPPGGELSAPLSVDITRHVNAPGRNRVEIKRAAGGPEAAAQVVTSYYVPWGDSPNVAPLTPAGGHASADAPPASLSAAGRPRLHVAYDRTEGTAGQPLTCRVEVSRGSSRGHGMLLAEVGLPPGAEVDRASLERALAAGNGLDRYDVLPDRVVLYVWPRADAPTRFDFKLTPRYGLRALTAPSQVYDYYNPQSRAVVPPTRFVIR